MYFNNLVRDEKGREFGEFYLTIDGIVTRLSEALVISYYAIYLEGGKFTFLCIKFVKLEIDNIQVSLFYNYRFIETDRKSKPI